jgi:hypothetical protein
MVRANITLVLIVFQAIASVTHASADNRGSLTPRILPTKEHLVDLPPGYRGGALYLRFVEGIDRQATISQMVDAASPESLPILKNASWLPEAKSVDPAKLATMHYKAEHTLGRQLPDPRQGLHIKLNGPTSAIDAINALNQRADVEIALPMPLPAPPPGELPDYTYLQVYLDAPELGGLNAENTWSQLGIDGAGVEVCDIEYSFNANHCDLPEVNILGAEPPTPDDIDWMHHGTAVLGILGSTANDAGISGIAHGAEAIHFSAPYNGNQYDVAVAVYLAASELPTGSIILIEQQIRGPNYLPDAEDQFGLVPVEWHEPWYNAIVTAVGNGMIVCEAAGNGSQNLDDPIYSQGNNGHFPFVPQNDSGAILVGAGGPYPEWCNDDTQWLSPQWFTNHGSCLDVQAWGGCVASPGKSNLSEETNCRFGWFSGTSSATAIVAGSCILVQSWVKQHLGYTLTSEEMRDLLVQTGQPQSSPEEGLIGPFPDVLAAISTINPCTGDLTNDGMVDIFDLLILLELWNEPYDLSNIDAVINSWGVCP